MGGQGGVTRLPPLAKTNPHQSGGKDVARTGKQQGFAGREVKTGRHEGHHIEMHQRPDGCGDQLPHVGRRGQYVEGGWQQAGGDVIRDLSWWYGLGGEEFQQQHVVGQGQQIGHRQDQCIQHQCIRNLAAIEPVAQLREGLFKRGQY